MFWAAIRDNVRQLGVVEGLLYAVDRVLRGLSRDRVRLVRYLLVAQPVPPEPASGLRPSTASPVREVGATDPVVRQFPRPPVVIAQRFEKGGRCLVAEVRGGFAGYLWLAFDGYDEDEVRCRYDLAAPASSVWDFDVFVAPEFRMGRTFARLWDAANRELRARGTEWSYSRISTFNPGSMAAHRRMGLRGLFTATFVCLGPFQLALFGTAPFVHMGWSAKSRPVIRLKAPPEDGA